MWNLKRHRKANVQHEEEAMLKTYNTPLPNPRLNIMRSNKDSNGLSAHGSQDVVLSGGIVIKGIYGSTPYGN